MILEILISILRIALLLTQEVSVLYGIKAAISRKSLFGFGSENAWNIDFTYFKASTEW
jgi:hypothetical protein